MLGELAALALTCAPNIAPVTLAAIVRHESRANPYAIGVNRGVPLKRQPATRTEATKMAKQLIRSGVDFDAGLGQINVRNWAWLGLTTETVFDPCANLTAAQTVLSECYRRALRTQKEQQRALRAALSCYNTGNLERGFQNGYVKKVLAQAGIKIPALEPVSPAGNTEPAAPAVATPPSKPATGSSDGFASNPARDGFSNSVGDGFTQPEPTTHKPTPAT